VLVKNVMSMENHNVDFGAYLRCSLCIGGGLGHGAFSKGRARAMTRRVPARRGGRRALPFENAP
jgi:hypothetical protein